MTDPDARSRTRRPGDARASERFREGIVTLAVVGLSFGVLTPLAALVMTVAGTAEPGRAAVVCLVTPALGTAGFFVLRRQRPPDTQEPAVEPEQVVVEPAVFTQTDGWPTLALFVTGAAAFLALALFSFATEAPLGGAFFLALSVAVVVLLVRGRGGLRCEITPQTITFSSARRDVMRGFSIARDDVERITVVGAGSGGWLVVRRTGRRTETRHSLGRLDAAAFAEALRRRGWPVVETR